MEDIAGKVALVTGGGRGLGRAICLGLAEKGVKIAVNFKSNQSEAENTCGLLTAAGVENFAIQADVSSSPEVSRMVAAVAGRFGSIDILVNNAGITHRDKIENLDEASWDRVIGANLKSAFLVTQACIGIMRRKKWGRLIFLSSIAAQTGGVTGPLYSASKAGMIGMAHSYAALLVKEGITANAIAPALVATDMVLHDLGVQSPPVPVGRFGRPEEVADVAVMLAGNGYITGQTINVNGGWHFSS